MSSELWGVVVASLDPTMLGRWWADALGWEFTVDTDGDAVVSNADPTVPTLLFERAGDAKSPAKNRVHLDLASQSDADATAIVDRLVAVGAARVDIGQSAVPWTVLIDPEGNEFCVLQGAS